MMTHDVLLQTNLKDVPVFRKGKVRDVYDLGSELLMVATDRISAFDCILPTGIPGKGQMLTEMSLFWFELLKDICPSHLIAADVKDYPAALQAFENQLKGRSMLVHKAQLIEVECIVRGYLTGSGWKEYQKTGHVCGIELPKKMQNSQKLEEPIFTPSTKAMEGHDENISFEKAAEIVGEDTMSRLRELSLSLYNRAAQHARERGIILCDTKFEFGWLNGEIILIDEVLTPDSSRFWDANTYVVGAENDSFDKQIVRNYLESLDWDKTPPAPELPADIVEKTQIRYADIIKRLKS